MAAVSLLVWVMAWVDTVIEQTSSLRPEYDIVRHIDKRIPRWTQARHLSLIFRAHREVQKYQPCGRAGGAINPAQNTILFYVPARFVRPESLPRVRVAVIDNIHVIRPFQLAHYVHRSADLHASTVLG